VLASDFIDFCGKAIIRISFDLRLLIMFDLSLLILEVHSCAMLGYDAESRELSDVNLSLQNDSQCTIFIVFGSSMRLPIRLLLKLPIKARSYAGTR